MVTLLLSLLLCAALQDGRVAFDSGMQLFREKQYQAALPLLEQAYRESGKRPSSIRALAQCERALKHYDRALEYFREYLTTDPSDKSSVEATIALLEKQLAETLVPEPPPPLPIEVAPPKPQLVPPEVTTTPEPEETFWSGPWPWVIGGVAVAAGATASGLMIFRSDPQPYGGSKNVTLEP